LAYRHEEVVMKEKTMRMSEGAISVQVRIREAELVDAVRSYVERKLQAGLQRFAGSLRNVQVTLQDVNGPRGGVDKSCRIAAELIPSRCWIRLEARNANRFAAIALAVKGVKGSWNAPELGESGEKQSGKDPFLQKESRSAQQPWHSETLGIQK
jgi:hypothetical protein